MHFDLRAPPVDFYDNPYPIYRQLQSESPVYALPGGGYLLTDYNTIRTVYRDPQCFSSDKRLQFAPLFGTDSPLYEHHTTSLVFNDPPLHTRVRKAIGNALSQKSLLTVRADLDRLVDTLLEQLAERRQFDLIADFASAIPVEIVGNLLGIPADERGPLRAWSLAILGSLEVSLTADQRALGNRSVQEFVAYLEDLLTRRAAAASEPDDILARLAHSHAAGAGVQLTAAELHHQCIFLLNAGHETTTNLIGNGIEALLRHPAQLARFRVEPQLTDSAIEEMLRFESSNQLGNRTTTTAVELSGVQIPADTVLTLCIGAANRDPAVFDRSDEFDIGRQPNPHLAFGAGIHTCAGLHVARLEAQVAIRRFFDRFDNVSVVGQPRRARRARFRGFETLLLRRD